MKLTFECLGRTILSSLLNVSLLAAAETSPGSTRLDAEITALQQIVTKDAGASAQAAGAASTNAAPGTTPGVALPSLESMNAIRFANSLQMEVDRKEFSFALNQLARIAHADPSGEVAAAIASLTPLLQAAEKAQAAEMTGQLKTVLDHATQAVLSAKDPKDLDAALSEIAGELEQSRTAASGDAGARQLAFTQLQGASRFLKLWQSYLVDKAAGNAQGATNELRNLSAGTNSFMPIPSSQLLELAEKSAAQAQQVPQAAEAKIELNSLDDLPGAISQLQVLQRSGGYSMDLNGLSSAMQNLENAYQAYREKNYAGALQQLVNNPFGMMAMAGPAVANGDSQEPLRQKLSDLKNTLVLDVVQALLAMPDAPAPQKGQTAVDYLQQLAAAKEKAADWPGLDQVLQVYQQVAPFNSAPWLQEDLTGLRSYFVGKKLESAGQHLDAIRSYRQSLATVGKFFPAEPPATELNDLQKKYPELYQQALQQPITHGP